MGKKSYKRRITNKLKIMPQGEGTYGSQVGRPSKKRSAFKMKGFTPFTQQHAPRDYHKQTTPQTVKDSKTKTRGLVKKDNETMGEWLKRVQSAGLTEQAKKIKAQMDKDYETAGWDKE